MNKIKSLFAAVALASLGTGAFGATVTATSIVDTIGDFTIEFTDVNSDGLLQYSEIDSFSGFSSELFSYSSVYTTPALAGVSVFESFNVYLTGAVDWDFIQSGTANVHGFTTSFWTYVVDLDPTGGGPGLSPVPLPAALPMLAGALGFFGFLRRRQRQAA